MEGQARRFGPFRREKAGGPWAGRPGQMSGGPGAGAGGRSSQPRGPSLGLPWGGRIPRKAHLSQRGPGPRRTPARFVYLRPMRRAAEALGRVDPEGRRHLPRRGLRDTRRYSEVSLGHPLFFAQGLHPLRVQLHVHALSFVLMVESSGRLDGPAGRVRLTAWPRARGLRLRARERAWPAPPERCAGGPRRRSGRLSSARPQGVGRGSAPGGPRRRALSARGRAGGVRGLRSGARVR